MLSFFTNQNLDNYVVLSFTITIIGITYCLINGMNEFDNITSVRQDNVTRERQVDTTRVHEGLPTDVTLTPEDFIANPELAEIFDVTDPNTNLDIALESNEHYELIENAAVDNGNLVTQIIEAFLSYFN